MICTRLKPAVSGLAQDFPGKVNALNVDAKTPESQKVIKELGFASHGLVIRSPDGKVLWKQADHQVRISDVRQQLQLLLAK